MELAGVFLRMVGPNPWNGPLKPLFVRADLTAPVTVVKAAASHTSRVSMVTSVAVCQRYLSHTATWQPHCWVYPAIGHDLMGRLLIAYGPASREWGRTFVVGVRLRANDLDLDLRLEEVYGTLSKG